MKKVAVLIETDRINDYHYAGVFKDFMAAFTYVLRTLRKENAALEDAVTEDDVVHLYTQHFWDYDIYTEEEVNV